ncbi:hypothetical protein PG991_014895 [Apiospora marii]|uniref:Uncharacterized protein n=2 Tax=Apiospora marii TaxID=335849 RepID=A0ABR1R4U6_9PEZI
MGRALVGDASAEAAHRYAMEQVQSFHSILVRKYAQTLRRDPHWDYKRNYFQTVVTPFIRDYNALAHRFSLVGDALAIQGRRLPGPNPGVDGLRNTLCRQNFIAVYRMAPEEALELTRLAVLRGERWTNASPSRKNMHAHINYIDGFINWRVFFMEESSQTERGGYAKDLDKDKTVFTRVIRKVDPLFAAYLEAVYQTARLLQGSTEVGHMHNKANWLKDQVNNLLAAEGQVLTWARNAIADSSNSVSSKGFITQHAAWAADPLRLAPLPVDRTMLPAEMTLPAQRSKNDENAGKSITVGTLEAARETESWLQQVNLTFEGNPPAARAPNAAGAVSYAQAGSKKRRASVNPYRDDDSFFDESSDGYDEEDTPVGSVFKRASGINKRRRVD